MELVRQGPWAPLEDLPPAPANAPSPRDLGLCRRSGGMYESPHRSASEEKPREWARSVTAASTGGAPATAGLRLRGGTGAGVAVPEHLPPCLLHRSQALRHAAAQDPASGSGFRRARAPATPTHLPCSPARAGAPQAAPRRGS